MHLQVVKNLPPSSDISSSIYQLELYHLDTHAEGLFPINYLSVFGIDDRIYARIWMNDGNYETEITSNFISYMKINVQHMKMF